MGVSFRQESAESMGAPPYGMIITIGSDHRCRGFDSRRTSSQRRRLLKREDNPGDNLPSGFSLSIGYSPYDCCLLGTATRRTADKGNGPIAGCDVLIALKAAEEASQFDFQPSTFTACA